MPDVAGGLAFAYNLTIGGRRVTNLRLSGAVISGIFTNQVTMWNDPRIAADNPGLALPATGITPVVRTDGAGSTAQLTGWMRATQGPFWTAYCQMVGRSPCTPTSAYPIQPGTAMIGQAGDPGVTGYVSQAQHNGAIGYTEYTYAIQAGLPVAKVLNAAGYYTLPTPDNVGLSLLAAQVNNNPSDSLFGTADLSGVYTDPDPRTYELSYYSYLIIPTGSTPTIPLTTNQGFSLGAFGAFALCQGQQQVDGLGYAALPINLVEQGFSQLQRIPGANLPGSASAFIASCDNPTFSTDGTDTLAATDPMPPSCDQQGATQCGGLLPPADTTTTVTANPNPVAAGQASTLTATVLYANDVAPAGSVQFEVGGAVLGTSVPLDANGVATTTTVFTTQGAQAVSAVFTPTDAGVANPSAGTLSVVVVPPGSAATQLLTTTVPPTGSFSLTVNPTDTVVLKLFDSNTAIGVINPVVITDTRNTYPGWSVSGQASDFTNPTSHPAGIISGDRLGWEPEGLLVNGVVFGGAVSPGAPGLGTIAAVLASANAGAGFGTTTVGAGLTLAIPPTVPSGTYTGVLTLTAVTAAP
jgi:ABC-type phosphate transport system substrate-binding protein